MEHLLAVMALLLVSVTIPAFAQQTPVYIQYKASDTVGSRLVYEVRQQLSATHDLRVVALEDKSFIQIHLVTIDPNENGYSTVYSSVITVTQFNGSTGKVYWNNYVGVCGANRVTECANSIAANIDNTVNDIRTALAQYLKGKQ